MKIENPNLINTLVQRADELQRKLDKLTNSPSNAPSIDEEQPITGTLLPRGEGSYEMVRMKPDLTMSTTRLRNQQLEGRQRMLERSLNIALADSKKTTDPSKKAKLESLIAETRETLSQVVREKVEQRTLCLSEVLELTSRLRGELADAVRTHNVEKQKSIRAKLLELSRVRRRQGALDTRN